MYMLQTGETFFFSFFLHQSQNGVESTAQASVDIRCALSFKPINNICVIQGITTGGTENSYFLSVEHHLFFSIR